MIYICLEGQYNYTQGRELDYDYMSDFLSGWISSSTDATWQGNIEGNKTIEEVMATLYNFNYTDVYAEGYDIYPNNVEDIHTKIEYIVPHGYCLANKQSKKFKYLSVSNQERLKVVVVDPVRTQPFSIPLHWTWD